MCQRCTNPKNPSFKYYGARGVTVSQQWLGRGGFARFFAEVGPAPSKEHSIDRINADRAYGPGNCRWATTKEQNSHLRSRKLITHKGLTLSLVTWARHLNISYNVLYNRLYVYKLSVEDSLSRPARSFKTYSVHSKEYTAWAKMKTRCYNPKDGAYAYYGGRGIRVCERWRKSFQLFLKDMGPAPSPKHTLDRIDSNKAYSPTNCRWATRREQATNTSQNVLIKSGNQILCLQDWSRKLRINITTLRWHLERGKTIQQIANSVHA
jgi:hypothetical protein